MKPSTLSRRTLERTFTRTVAVHHPMLTGTFGPGYWAHADAGSYRYVLCEAPLGVFIVVLEKRRACGSEGTWFPDGVVVTFDAGSPASALRRFVEEFLPKPDRNFRYHKLVWAKPAADPSA